MYVEKLIVQARFGYFRKRFFIVRRFRFFNSFFNFNSIVFLALMIQSACRERNLNNVSFAFYLATRTGTDRKENRKKIINFTASQHSSYSVLINFYAFYVALTQRQTRHWFFPPMFVYALTYICFFSCWMETANII